MSIQATLSEFDATGDIGQWRLATDEPGFYSLRRYWRTDEYVLVANQNTGSFAVYDVETWDSGTLGEENQPFVRRRGLADAIASAKDWMSRHRDGGLEA